MVNTMGYLRKLNLGCGTDIRKDCINQDIMVLNGVDVISDLSKYPYPFKDNTFNEIFAISVLEHLPQFVETMSELHRICAPGGSVYIRVPFWNSEITYIDPTHFRGFSERTFHFFDPRSFHYQERPYYSTARFHIQSIEYRVKIPFQWRSILIKSSWKKRLFSIVATFFCNVIWELQVELKAVKG